MTARFGNLAGRPPMGLKGTTREPKAKRPSGKDLAYLRALHQLPCVICENFGEIQTSPTTAHHTICGRYSQRKTPDRQAIPLCDGHHQGDHDTTKTAIHRDRAEWVRRYGPDTDYIAATQDAVAGQLTRET